MDRIYRQAQLVIIWLGPADTYTSDAFNAICSLANISGGKFENLNLLSDMLDFKPYKTLGIPYLPKSMWRAVHAIFHRPWFGRAWTVQKYALAREVTFYCGSWGVHGGILYNAMRFIHSVGWSY